ncbi:lymphatic vessel endothelial hyaluronic receptor 1b isoform X2 [Stigmatopora argus]
MVVLTDPNLLTPLLTLTITSSLLKVVSLSASEGQSGAGVFLLMEYQSYNFNFTAASTACQSRQATMATTTNVEEALRHGLETCKFGWVAEQVAVIPRVTGNARCGNGKTGLVKWYASLDKTFGVFCFSATAPQKSTMSAVTSSTLFPTTPTVPPLPSSTTVSSPSPATTNKVPLLWTFISAHASTSSPPLPPHSFYSSSSAHPFPSHVVTSSLASTPTLTHASNQQRPTEAPLKAFWSVLIVLAVVFMVVIATGLLCYYYKLKNEPFRSRALQGDDLEAEMWKPTDSRTDLHDQLKEDHEEEEEEEQRDAKYSSDIMLCVNPQFRGGNTML